MRLLLTRPLEQSLSLKVRLEEAGFEVECLPLIEIVPPSDGGSALQKSLKNISEYQWLVLTSQHAVDAVAEHLKTPPPDLKIAAIGSKTAKRGQNLGWNVCLLDQIQDQNLKGAKVLYPRSSIGLDKWIERLQKMGATVDVVEAYQTRPTSLPHSTCYHMVKSADAVLFFSPSAVHEFVSLRGAEATKQSPSGFEGDCFASLAMTIAMIPFGPTTSQALIDAGYKPAFIPSQSDETILVKELKEFFKSRG